MLCLIKVFPATKITEEWYNLCDLHFDLTKERGPRRKKQEEEEEEKMRGKS